MRHGHGVVILAVVGVCLGSGCVGESRCEVEERDAGGSRITCPGREPVETEDSVSGPCWKKPGGIKCSSGQTFSSGGARDGGSGVPSGREAGSTADVWTSDAASRSRSATTSNGGFGGGYRSPPSTAECQKVGRKVICNDGTRGTVGKGVEGPCRSKMVLGVGRRIVCKDGTRVRPENKDKGKVECEYVGSSGKRAIQCSDGTVVTGKDVPKKKCEPTVRRKANDVVVVECGQMEKEVSWKKGRCEGPFLLQTKRDLRQFRRRKCEIVVGDLKLSAKTCKVQGRSVDCPNTPPVKMRKAVTPPCWRTKRRIACSGGSWRPAPSTGAFGVVERIRRLGRVEYVTGSVVISGNPKLRDVGLNGLVRVGKDVVISNNPSLRELRGLRRLLFVGGSVQVSKNAGLRGWRPPMGLWVVKGSLALASNERLTLIGELGRGNPRFSKYLDIRNGTGIVTDNDALGWCMSTQFGRFLGGRGGADQVYVGGVSSKGKKKCGRINWVK